MHRPGLVIQMRSKVWTAAQDRREVLKASRWGTRIIQSVIAGNHCHWPSGESFMVCTTPAKDPVADEQARIPRNSRKMINSSTSMFRTHEYGVTHNVLIPGFPYG